MGLWSDSGMLVWDRFRYGPSPLPEMEWRPFPAHPPELLAGRYCVYRAITSPSALGALPCGIHILNAIGRLGCGQRAKGCSGEDGAGRGLVQPTHPLPAG